MDLDNIYQVQLFAQPPEDWEDIAGQDDPTEWCRPRLFLERDKRCDSDREIREDYACHAWQLDDARAHTLLCSGKDRVRELLARELLFVGTLPVDEMMLGMASRDLTGSQFHTLWARDRPKAARWLVAHQLGRWRTQSPDHTLEGLVSWLVNGVNLGSDTTVAALAQPFLSRPMAQTSGRKVAAGTVVPAAS